MPIYTMSYKKKYLKYKNKYLEMKYHQDERGVEGELYIVNKKIFEEAGIIINRY